MNEFEINVALNGHHHISVTTRNTLLTGEAIELAKEVQAKYPAAEGYAVTLTSWSKAGRHINLD